MARRQNQQGGFQNAMANEIERQAKARMMAAGHGQFREYYNIYYRLTTGGAQNPRIIITALVGVLGFLGAGAMALFSAVAAFVATQMH
jgi:hypothetical protein